MLPVTASYMCTGYAGKRVVFGEGGWEYFTQIIHIYRSHPLESTDLNAKHRIQKIRNN